MTDEPIQIDGTHVTVNLEVDRASVGKEAIEHRFGFHKATVEGENATLPMHRDTRLLFRAFAETLDHLLPEGRAKSVAFTELENASMWAHKAIAELAPAIREEPENAPVTYKPVLYETPAEQRRRNTEPS